MIECVNDVFSFKINLCVWILIRPTCKPVEFTQAPGEAKKPPPCSIIQVIFSEAVMLYHATFAVIKGHSDKIDEQQNYKYTECMRI